jgi:hypothetical protein
VPGIAAQGEYYCPSKVSFRTTPKDWADLHFHQSYHYLNDPIINQITVDFPPYRFCFCSEYTLACHFKGMAGMQFEGVFKMEKLEATKENVDRLLKRIKSLVIFT